MLNPLEELERAHTPATARELAREDERAASEASDVEEAAENGAPGEGVARTLLVELVCRHRFPQRLEEAMDVVESLAELFDCETSMRERDGRAVLTLTLPGGSDATRTLVLRRRLAQARLDVASLEHELALAGAVGDAGLENLKRNYRRST
ncbi:hypothetical protein [Chondromyces apiculatus]|uniref:hypothetical protein n=1 Tax=Chondromyces apiculatus TaxID=51 RepID=UPI0012DF38FF|nr:hypothetical protein [Chondromyces apiculatus]